MMAVNNEPLNTTSERSHAQFFLRSLLAIFPDKPLEEAWSEALKLSNSPRNDEYEKIFSSLNYEDAKNDEIVENLNAMDDAGFDMEHIMLYLAAPKESELGNKTTKKEYLKIWNKEGNFTPQASAKEAVERGLMATTSLITLIGVTTIVPGMLVGLYINDPATVETGQLMANNMIGVVADFSDTFSNPTAKNVIQSTLTALGIGVMGMTLRRQTKNAEDIDLRSKIRDGAEDYEDKERLFKELKNMPISLQHLISHFTPEETCLFLLADESSQAKIWRKRPPSFEQRCLSNLIDGKGNILEKLWQQTKLSGSFWDSDQTLAGPVNIKNSLLKFREHKDNLKSKVVTPSNRPSLKI